MERERGRGREADLSPDARWLLCLEEGEEDVEKIRKLVVRLNHVSDERERQRKRGVSSTPSLPPSPRVLHQLSEGPESHLSLGQRAGVLQHRHENRTEILDTPSHVLPRHLSTEGGRNAHLSRNISVGPHLNQFPDGGHNVDDHVGIEVWLLQLRNQHLPPQRGREGGREGEREVNYL